jgi:hypothetical protein
MDLLEIKPSTPKSFGVNFSPDGVLQLYGVSCDENPRLIYEQLKSWVKEYSLAPAPKTEFSIRLKYFNTSSSKCLYELLETVVLLDKAGKKLTITWYFEKDDEDMEETIVLFEDLIKRKIDRVAVDSYTIG